MNGYWAIGIFIFGFFTGIYAEHEIGIAKRVTAQDQQIEATQRGQEATNAAVGTSNAKIDQLTAANDSLKEKYNVLPTTDCKLPDASFELLRQSAAAANNAAK